MVPHGSGGPACRVAGMTERRSIGRYRAGIGILGIFRIFGVAG